MQIPLILHLLGAVFLGIAATIAIAALARSRTRWYRRSAIALGLGSFWQLATGGAMLLAASKATSPAAYCGRIGLYVGLVAVLVAALAWRARGVGQRYPVRPASIGLIAGLVLALSAGLARF